MRRLRTTAIAAALTAGALALTACGGSSSSDAAGSGEGTQAATEPSTQASAPAQGGELNVLSLYKKTGPEGPAMEAALKAFTDASGATLNFVEAGEDLGTEYEATVAAGEEADVVIVNLFENSAAWVKNGAAVPVGDLISEWGLDSVIKPAAIEEWTNADGQVQGFAYQGFSWPVWYNTDLLTKAGVTEVPTSTDDLIAAAEKLEAAGIPPVVVGGNDWSGNKLWLQIIQSYLAPDEAKEVFTNGGFCANPNVMKGIDEFVRLRDAGVFVKGVEGYTADQMNAAYYEGQAAIMPAGSWAMPGAPEAVASVTQLGGFPVPSGGTYTKPTAYQGYTGVGFFISPKGAEKLDLVKQFVTTFYQPEIIGGFVTSAAIVPATDTDIAASLTGASPLLQQAITTVPTEVEYAVMPDIYVGARGDALTKASGLAYSPGTSAEEICGAADQAYE